MSRSRLAASLLAYATVTSFAAAQGTHLWTQSRYEEFEKGRPHGMAIRSDGSMIPGPRLSSVFATPSTYIWAIASDNSGDAYVATGSPATVLKITPYGKSTKLFESKDLTVQAICLGPDGSVYAATLPSGKVYKLKPNATGLDESSAPVAFDPEVTTDKPKYIWQLLFDKLGRLYVATGGPAAIYRVDTTRDGARPELFFKSDEQHVRCMTFDRQGDLIAGSDGSGLVYRIGQKDGKGFILYDAAKREITSLAVGEDSGGKEIIYASAVGERGRGSLPPLPLQGLAAVTATITIVQPGSVQASSTNSIVTDGSEIDEITASGAPRKLWADRETVVYALRATPQGLLAATGNRGRIYRIHENGEFEDLAHLEASQAVAFADAPSGYLIATANSGRLYSLAHAADPDAFYESDVFDAGVVSRWGRAEVHGGTNANSVDFDLMARTGNVEGPERNWSDWVKVAPGAANLGMPPARFIQWRAMLHAGASVTSVGLNYLPVNVSPVIDEVMVQPGARVNVQAQMQQQPQSVNIAFPSAQNSGVAYGENSATSPISGFKDKNAVTIRWAAHDENGDELSFALFFRAEGTEKWLLLKDGITDRFYSFDAALLPDASYRIKVVASDSPSHNPGEGLTSDRVSERFVIDTAPPVISGLTARLETEKVHVTGTATDLATPVSRAEYSVDAGPWQYIEPVGGLSDSVEEHYDFSAPLKAGLGEHVVTLRAYDRYENVSVAKIVVR